MPYERGGDHLIALLPSIAEPYSNTEFFREGYAWVGMSAQFVGIEGGGAFELPTLGCQLEAVAARLFLANSRKSRPARAGLKK